MPKPKQIKWKTPHIINTWFVAAAAAVSHFSISFSCFSWSCKNSPGSGLMKLVQLFAEYFAAWKLWPFEMTRTEQSFVFEIIFCSVKSFFCFNLTFHQQVIIIRSSLWMQHIHLFMVRNSELPILYAWCRNVKRLKTFIILQIDHCVWPTYLRRQSLNHDHRCTFIIYYLRADTFTSFLVRIANLCVFLFKTNDSRLANLPCTLFYCSTTSQSSSNLNTFLIGWKGKKAEAHVNVSTHLPHISTCCPFYRQFSSINSTFLVFLSKLVNLFQK